MAEYLIPAAASILIAVIEIIAAKDRKAAKENSKKTEARAAVRAEENRLSMQMMNASLGLGFATALALEQHKLNGEMHAAKAAAEKAQKEYQEFLQRVAAKEVAKA